MKKRAMSLFLAVSMSFTLFYPELSLNDNVLEDVSYEKSEEETVEINGEKISLTQLLRMPRGEKKFKLRLLEWFSELCG